MRRAKGVDVDGERRVFPREQAGGAGVIEMNMGHEHAGEILEGEANAAQRLAQVIDGGAGAGFDQHQLIIADEQVRGNDLLAALKAEVDQIQAGVQLFDGIGDAPIPRFRHTHDPSSNRPIT